MDLKLKGRSALITGGSKGIGFGVARWLAAEGCNIRLVARTAADLDQAAAKLKAGTRGVDVRTFAVDVADGAARKRTVDQCGEIDILVNSAGGIPGGNLQDVDEAKWRAAWDAKVYGHINMCREVFYRMKARGKGVIINVIGMGGERLDDHYIAGATGNAALMAFTKALGSTSIDHGVRVIGVNPGPVETERLEFLGRKRAQDRLGDADRWREFFKEMPLGRPATVDETVAMVAFLSSDLCSYMSGTIVTIDGGLANRGALP
jgi:NAD(P)-dependent dehydrogenase (short-subunit alcohol dehydrogenase family)